MITMPLKSGRPSFAVIELVLIPITIPFVVAQEVVAENAAAELLNIGMDALQMLWHLVTMPEAPTTSFNRVLEWRIETIIAANMAISIPDALEISSTKRGASGRLP